MSIPRLDVFQVLGDPSRRQILQLLAEKSRNINSITEHFAMSRPAISKHIKILHNSGFINIQIEGREHFCTLNKKGFDEIKQWINYFDKFWNTKLSNLENLLNNKIKH